MTNRLKVLSLLLLIVGGLYMYTIIQLNESQISTYDIFEEDTLIEKAVNWAYSVEKDDRIHPLINIQKILKSPSDKLTACSAFVVNNEYALTAAHCLGLTTMHIQQTIPKINKLSLMKEHRLLELITHLESSCSGGILCSSQLKRAEYQLNRELQDRKKSLVIVADTYNITNINGTAVGKVTAYYKDIRRDYGFLKGDFSKFKKVYLKKGWKVKKNDILRACGFYGSKLPPVCVDFKAVSSWGFQYKGYSMFVPGVSGGPVYNHEGYVVGIASKAVGNFAIIEPILGIMTLIDQ